MSWPREYMQEYSQRKIKNSSLLTNYAKKLTEEIETYIPMSIQAIGYNEIFFKTYSSRQFEWCVPGNRNIKYYAERENILNIMREEEKKTDVWSFDPFQKLSVDSIEKKQLHWYKFRNNFEKCLTCFVGKNKYISSYPKSIYVAACRENYLDSLRDSKKVYVDGGIGEFIVRKYFESCASGALTVVKKVPGLENMGFIDGKNCIVIDGYSDIERRKKELSNEEKNAQIAREGQKMILENHMFYHRAEALYQTIEAIKRGTYKTAIWQNGKYIIREK